MKPSLITTCIMCNKQIKMSGEVTTVLDAVPGAEIKTEMLSCGFERTYYLCPHCGYKYTVMLTDEDISNLMGRREKLKGYAGIKNNGVREKKKNEYEALDNEIKEKLNKLNHK